MNASASVYSEGERIRIRLNNGEKSISGTRCLKQFSWITTSAYLPLNVLLEHETYGVNNNYSARFFSLSKVSR